ncbi:MAG: 6-phosphofructokinase [Chthoniobacterales bacterium]
MTKQRIGVLTSGGDCPGLNAVLRGVTLAAEKRDWEVVGFLDGFEGLLPPARYMTLDRARIAGIAPRGGTILGTTNRGHFVAKIRTGEKARVPAEIIETSRKVLAELEVRALIIIGGDGSMNTALQLQEGGIDCIGVPKTIDNDIEATAMTFGFDSAVNSVMDALDRLHTTATSHNRAMVLEVMGRHAGWIALHGGIAGGAHVILIPEIPFDYDSICEAVKRREARGVHGAIVVVAEGARPRDGQQVFHPTASGEYRFGGIGDIVAHEITRRSEKETRCTVLGHLQRGGAPTTLDRILGTRFGVKAVNMAGDGNFGSMVSYQNYQVRHVPIADAVNRLRLVPVEGELVQTARDVDICFGD